MRSGPLLALPLATLMCFGSLAAAQDRPAPPPPPATTPAQPGTIDLRPKFTAGTEARYTIEQSGVRDVTIPNQPAASQSQTQRYGVVVRTKAVDPSGNATVEVVYDSIAATTTYDGREQRFDSTKPAGEDGDSVMAPILRPMVGRTLTLTVAPSGKITGVTGDQQIPAEFRDPETVAEVFGPLFSTTKEPPRASVGDTWTDEQSEEVAPGVRAVQTTRHTLAAVNGPEAVVETSGRLELSAPAGKRTPYRITESSQIGRYVWDTSAGALRSLELQVRATVEDDTQGVTAVQKTTQTVRIARQP